jgi:hypothetical protein
MAAASRSLATALLAARFASGLLRLSYTTKRDTTGCVDSQAQLTARGLREVHDRDSTAFRAAEVLLKGPEARLPNGWSFRDKDGHLRHEARLRWWDPTATTFRAAALGMEGRESNLPDEPVPPDFFYRDEPPVLFGYYWLNGEPHIQNPRASA